MVKMKLNESYLHNVVMSSINKLIKEDISDSSINYLDDIINGTVDDIECKGGNMTVNIIGASDSYHNNYEGDEVIASYVVKCYVSREETYAGSSGDYYNPPEPSEYDDELDVESVTFSNDYMTDVDITNQIDIEKLKSWLMGVIDWDDVDNIYTLDDRYWDAQEDRYND